MTIEKYVLVDQNDVEGDHEYDDYDEAVNDAGTTHAVIARQYEYTDSTLVWTPNGKDTWPPRKFSRSK